MLFIRNFILCGLMVIVACEVRHKILISVLNSLMTAIVIQVKEILILKSVVQTTIVPIPCGMTDAKHVCVLMPAIPLGVMAVRNRKCNPVFKPKDFECLANWQCAKEFTCEHVGSRAGYGSSSPYEETNNCMTR